MQLFAQITLERSDYIRAADQSYDEWTVDLSSITAPPTTGPNQVWDYSNINLVNSTTQTPVAGNHASFPEANLVITTNEVELGLLPVTINFYEVLNEDEYSTLGRITSPVSANLEPLTGNNMDMIELNGTVNVYEDHLYKYKFPVDYEDYWSSLVNFREDFLLTIQSFGLNQTPGQRVLNLTNINRVLGWGTLSLPNPDGGAPISIEALLFKEESITIDSLYLGGAPAPPALISAFGLQQGDITTSVEYRFIAKGLSRSAFYLKYENGVLMEVDMADDVKNLAAPLAAEWLNFSASVTPQNQVTLNWQTLSDANQSHFVIERGLEAADFSSIGEVAADKNLANTPTYDFIDVQPEKGINYYRLQQIDEAGEVSFSNVVTAFLSTDIGDDPVVVIFPNPGKDELWFNQAVAYELFDVQGQLLTAGTADGALDVSGLGAGLYFVKINGGEMVRWVKQ